MAKNLENTTIEGVSPADISSEKFVSYSLSFVSCTLDTTTQLSNNSAFYDGIYY